MSRTRRSTLFQALCALILILVLVVVQSAPGHSGYELLPKWPTDGQSMTRGRYLHHATDLKRRYEECDWANLDVSGTSKCAERVRYGDKVLCLLGKSLADSKAEQSQFVMSIAKMESEYGWITEDTLSQSPTGMGLDDAFAALDIHPEADQWISLKQEHGRTPTVPATHAEYTNRFSSSQATIIAQMNFGTEWSYAYNELDFPLNLMVKLKQWSDVVYNGIIGTINKQGYAAFRPFNIKHVFRHNLIDKGVIAVLQSVIESDTPKRWPGSQFAISTPQARAVLSVANAKGIWWMLASHKEALGIKTIDQVNIFECSKLGANKVEWCIYFHVVDVEQEPESDGDDDDGDGDGDGDGDD